MTCRTKQSAFHPFPLDFTGREKQMDAPARRQEKKERGDEFCFPGQVSPKRNGNRKERDMQADLGE